MSSRAIFTRHDRILLGVSATCIVILLFSSNLVVDVVAGLPLILYFPGAALVSTLGGRHHHAGVVERQVWVVGASIGLSVLGGIVLNLTGGLTRSSWIVWTGAVIVACIAIKSLLPRESNRTVPKASTINAGADGVSVFRDRSNDGLAGHRVGYGSKRISVRQVVLLLGAGAICAGAFVLSIQTDSATTKEPLVQAWVLPRPSANVFSTSVQLGLRNQLGKAKTFYVEVAIGAEPIHVFTVTLADGASWNHVIPRRPGEMVESTIYAAAQPRVVLTKVYLATPVTKN